jgi:hypothetical protein
MEYFVEDELLRWAAGKAGLTLLEQHSKNSSEFLARHDPQRWSSLNEASKKLVETYRVHVLQK